MKTRVPGVVAVALGLAIVPSAAQAALIADWEMNEGAGATVMIDSAGRDNNGAITSVETGVAGLAGGKAYKFDGSTSYIQVPDRSNLDPGKASMTVTATVKVENAQIIDDSYEVIRKGVVTTPGGEWKMEIKRSGTDSTVGKLHCVFKGVQASGATSAGDVVAGVDVVDSQAHQLQCRKTSTRVIALVDGKAYPKTVNVGSIANDQPVIIGAKTAGDDVMQGIIDRVKITIG